MFEALAVVGGFALSGYSFWYAKEIGSSSGSGVDFDPKNYSPHFEASAGGEA